MTDDALPAADQAGAGPQAASEALSELTSAPRRSRSSSERPTVLVVDNEHYIRLLARTAMEQCGFEVVESGDGKEALAVFEQSQPDVVLLDMSMPVMDGFAACAKLRELPHGKHVPILIMTGFDDLESIQRAYEVGATDFVVKPINWMILNHRIEYMLRASHAAEQIRFLAYYDTLTELPNRHAFATHLESVLTPAQDRGCQNGVGVLFLDLDRFKRINDSLGHTTGDRLLQKVATRLIDHRPAAGDPVDVPTRPELIARLGSDEFVMLLHEDRRTAARLARRLVESFAEPFTLDGQEFFLTASVGVALHPDDGEDADSLIKNAYTAMHRAKGQGGNGFQVYDPAMNAKALEGLVLENKLGNALERGELELFYQPQFDLSSRQAVGVEALLRWRHPELGILLPERFVPLAEKTGLIGKIGDWALRSACEQAVRWQHDGLPRLRTAVNLSGLQFARPDFAERLAGVLSHTGMDPGTLELELTESILMQDGDGTVRSLEALKAMGVRLAIDDFGTGYSSLSYLMRFPLDVLKIDRSFLRGIPEKSEHVAIISAILAMAQSLRLKVIAEGVETEEQVRFLHDQGCEIMQGFLLAEPAPADEIEELLRQTLPTRRPETSSGRSERHLGRESGRPRKASGSSSPTYG